ncbi:Sau3AI family type II restriction endonuclease [Bacillus sp. UNC41MFS5]|uniref:Sau3AI family type II restriction endonuclease n=1 Tax=Bacillus sp. UNC41MFS5 TaxID=1449046 RepID=UPI000AC3F84D|nr:Sau3AI family type II restriction endonuclease [Bacillus sp. UNC41MFS5]
MEAKIPYDISSSSSIEAFAKKLIGKTFRDVLPEDYKMYEGKGGLGQLLEKYYFLYEPNSEHEPDFKEAGVELKTTPFKKLKKGDLFSAKERLVLNIINYMEVHKEEFENSSFLHKNKLILLIFYLFEEDIASLDYQIKFAQLFEFSEVDLKIIKDDWNKIIRKIRAGEAHLLSESDTNYLAACTKGANASSVRKQPFSDEPAKQRAFSLKGSYMTQLLRDYIFPGKKTYHQEIVKDTKILESRTFEDYVLDRIHEHQGKSIEEIAKMYGVKDKPNSKNYASKVALAMLGVQTKNALEFEKGNIKVKTIRVEQNCSVKESMSFPAFKFTEIIKEDWELSSLRQILLDTRFLFVIYQFNLEGNLILDRGMFWNIPYHDLETEVKMVWEKTISIIKSGVKVVKKSGIREFNNLPSGTENRVAHVRPHGRDKTDTYPLPTGGEFTKQSFWLNNSYIKEQISKNELKNLK